MRILSHIFLVISYPTIVFTQNVVFNIGQHFYKTKSIVQIIDGYNEVNNIEYFSLSLSFNKKKISYGVELTGFPGWTEFSVNGDKNPSLDYYGGHGSSRVNLLRISPYVGRDLLSKRKRISVIPFFKLSFEQSRITGFSDNKSKVALINLAGYNGTIYVEPFKRFQIMPGAGLNVKWNPFWRVVLDFNIQYLYGFRPYQKYYFEYEYLGVNQPTGEYYGDGSGVDVTLGIGYKFSKNKK